MLRYYVHALIAFLVLNIKDLAQRISDNSTCEYRTLNFIWGLTFEKWIIITQKFVLQDATF
jgi:hypothetical protein